MSNSKESCSRAGLAAPQRNNYFYGKLLDERTLRQEQGYLNQKRWMLNRLSLGKGVLCGLTVTWADDRVCIAPGVAIDGCGREIVVPEPIVIDPWQTTDDSGRPAARLAEEETHHVFICLAYLECPTDPTPVLVTDCDNLNRTAASTIVEKYAVMVKEVAEGTPKPLPPALDTDLCQALSGDDADAEAKRKDVCGVLSSRGCVDVESPSCVVIASRITLTEAKVTDVDVCSARPVVYSNPELFEMLLCRSEGGGAGTPGPAGPEGPGIDAVEVTKLECDAEPWATLAPDTNNPPNQILQLGIPRGCDGKPGTGLDATLTKIVKTNWTHDGKMDWGTFLKDGLQVDFSGEIAAKPKIDPGWMLVSIELSGGKRREHTDPTLKLIASIITFLWPPGSHLVYRAEGTISMQSNSARHYATFRPSSDLAEMISFLGAFFVEDVTTRCRVVVKCDFLIDKNGKPIDGNHLRGTLPSGDRVAGGEFESWFELVELPD